MSTPSFRLSLESPFARESTSSGGPLSTRDIALYFVRTETGDSELRRPVLVLTTPGRELLFAIERTMAIDVCVSAARGSSLADAMLLLTLGLIRMASLEANGASPSHKLQLQSVMASILALPANELYPLLTQHAKLRLGLLHGFRMILALERCVSHHEQRALAVRFVEQIWRAHGEAGIRPLSVSLRS